MIDPQEISEDDSSSTSEELINAAPPARYEYEDAAAAAALPDEPPLSPILSPERLRETVEHHLMLFDKLDRNSPEDCKALYETFARMMMQIAIAHCRMVQDLHTDEMSTTMRELNAWLLQQLAEKSAALGKLIVNFPHA